MTEMTEIKIAAIFGELRHKIKELRDNITKNDTIDILKTLKITETLVNTGCLCLWQNAKEELNNKGTLNNDYYSIN